MSVSDKNDRSAPADSAASDWPAINYPTPYYGLSNLIVTINRKLRSADAAAGVAYGTTPVHRTKVTQLAIRPPFTESRIG